GVSRDMERDRSNSPACDRRRDRRAVRRARPERRRRFVSLQRFDRVAARGNASTKLTAYGIGYGLNLFSNFTFFLDGPVRGDQFEQGDRRFVAGGKATHRRLGHWMDRETQNTFGVQLRNDDIATVGLYHTQQRARLSTTREDAVVQTSASGYAQNETIWTPKLRTLAGIRADGYHFDV